SAPRCRSEVWWSQVFSESCSHLATEGRDQTVERDILHGIIQFNVDRRDREGCGWGGVECRVHARGLVQQGLDRPLGQTVGRGYGVLEGRGEVDRLIGTHRRQDE